MKKRFFVLFLTMALLLPAVLLSGCASADSGIMDTANLNATAAGGDSSLPVVTWKMGSVWGAGKAAAPSGGGLICFGRADRLHRL